MEQAVSDHTMFFESVAQPEYAVYFNAGVCCELAKCSVAGQQGPLALFRQGKCETVLHRQSAPFPADGRRTRQFGRCKLFDTQAKPGQLFAKITAQFAVKQQI
jgi:hypothetical protein